MQWCVAGFHSEMIPKWRSFKADSWLSLELCLLVRIQHKYILVSESSKLLARKDDTKLSMCFRDCLIPFSLPAECRKFVCSLLQCCVGERLSSSMMLYEMWPNIQPINRPSPLMPSMIPKYTIEKCLPPHIAFPIITPVPAPALVASTPIHLLPKDTAPQRTVSSSTSQSSSSKTSKPLVMKIGACGRKIADAVKQVGHHKTECSERATN